MAAVQPNNVTITLPSGMTYADLQSAQIAIAVTVSAVFAVIVWDYFCLLPEEIYLYRMMYKDKRILANPTTYLFIILRYAGIFALLPALFFSAAQSSHCHTAIVTSQIGVVLGTMAAGAIFCFRVFAIYNDNRLIQSSVLLAYLFMLACWIAVATQYSAQTGPATPFGSNCISTVIPTWNPISWGSSVAFDALVLALTVAKIRPSLAAKNSAVGRQLFRDNLMYFIITAVTNLVTLALESSPRSTIVTKAAAIAFPPLMTTAMGTRVYLNLRLLEVRRRREMDSLPMSGVTTTTSQRATRDRGETAKYQQPYMDGTIDQSVMQTATYGPGFNQATQSTDKVGYDLTTSNGSFTTTLPSQTATYYEAR